MYVGIAFVRAKLYGPCASGARLGDVGKAEWACPLDCFGHSDRPVGIERCGGYGWIAQLVEQRTENPCVPGSSPGPATTFFPAKMPCVVPPCDDSGRPVGWLYGLAGTQNPPYIRHIKPPQTLPMCEDQRITHRPPSIQSIVQLVLSINTRTPFGATLTA